MEVGGGGEEGERGVYKGILTELEPETGALH